MQIATTERLEQLAKSYKQQAADAEERQLQLANEVAACLTRYAGQFGTATAAEVDGVFGHLLSALRGYQDSSRQNVARAQVAGEFLRRVVVSE